MFQEQNVSGLRVRKHINKGMSIAIIIFLAPKGQDSRCKMYSPPPSTLVTPINIYIGGTFVSTRAYSVV